MATQYVSQIRAGSQRSFASHTEMRPATRAGFFYLTSLHRTALGASSAVWTYNFSMTWLRCVFTCKLRLSRLETFFLLLPSAHN